MKYTLKTITIKQLIEWIKNENMYLKSDLYSFKEKDEDDETDDEDDEDEIVYDSQYDLPDYREEIWNNKEDDSYNLGEEDDSYYFEDNLHNPDNDDWMIDYDDCFENDSYNISDELMLSFDINNHNLKDLYVFEKDDIDFIQRHFIWKWELQKKLMDTILNDLFIPSLTFYDTERKKYKYLIVDGKQRINTIWMYYDWMFHPRSMFEKKLDDFINSKNPKFYEEEEIKKNKFLNFKIPIVIIKETSNENLKKIFNNLHTETIKLTPQEKRNINYINNITREINNFYKREIRRNFPIIRLFLKITFVEKKHFFNKTIDEFLIKLIRLFVNDGEILNDKKSDLDKYYENFNVNEKLFKGIGKTRAIFFESLKDVLEFYLYLQNQIKPNIRNFILIYILFYFSIIERKINLNDKDKKHLEIWKQIFDELSKDSDFNKCLKNPNKKSEREIALKIFDDKFSQAFKTYYDSEVKQESYFTQYS